MSARLCTLAILLLAVTFSSAPGAAPPPSPATKAEIERVADQLGDDNFDVREAASKKLRALGPRAEAALENALKSMDREVVRRALAILEDVRWGIYPDTPEAVVEAVRDYKTGLVPDKLKAARKLSQAGPAGWPALLKVVRQEKDDRTRTMVLGMVEQSLNTAVPHLVERGELYRLEPLLDQLLAADVHATLGTYTVFWLLRGELPARIAHHRALLLKNPADKDQPEILFRLLRARGDLPAARKIAEDAGRDDLLEAALWEAGDWKTLAARPELMSATDPIEKLALKAAYARLSWNAKEYSAHIAELRKLGTDEDGKRDMLGVLPLQLGKSLFLNAQPKFALEELARGGEHRWQQLEVLLARDDFRAAKALMEEARKSPAEMGRMEVAWARALFGLGEKDEATKIFKAQADRIKKDVSFDWFPDLIEAELRCGLTDLAFEHSLRILEIQENNLTPASFWERLFPEQTAEATSLYEFLTRPGGLPPKDALPTVRMFMTGKATEKELEEQAGAVRRADRVDSARFWLALGESAWRAKQMKLAQGYLGTAKSSAALMRLGDLYADAKQWGKAADSYLASFRLMVDRPIEDENQDGEPALALFLAGRALELNGQVEEGKRRQEQAHWLPLGNERVRAAFVRALFKRGQYDGVRRSNEIVLRTASPGLQSPGALSTAEASRIAAVDAATRRDHLVAAANYERASLRCLRPDIYFSRPMAYSSVPGFIHRHRALGLLKAGKVDEAIIEASRARDAQPGNVDVSIDLFALLDRQGRKKEAESLYRETQTLLKNVLADHPRCGWVHNSLAWMSACCRRDLEEGLKNARKAVELSPESAGSIDTLAEVLFQLGKKDEAIAAQKKAIALDPKRLYFRKQLARIEAGDPKVDRPVDEE
jgi:tetratricopeptide (TPR) repeat protein